MHCVYLQDSGSGTPVTMRVDPKGFFLCWVDQNNEMVLLDIATIRDVRTGQYAKKPRVSLHTLFWIYIRNNVYILNEALLIRVGHATAYRYILAFRIDVQYLPKILCFSLRDCCAGTGYNIAHSCRLEYVQSYIYCIDKWVRVRATWHWNSVRTCNTWVYARTGTRYRLMGWMLACLVTLARFSSQA